LNIYLQTQRDTHIWGHMYLVDESEA